MSKPARALLFMLAATLANILVTAVVFVLLLVLYGLTLGRVLKTATAAPAIFACFLAAVVAAAFAYKKGLDWARRKWNLEEKLGFGGKAPKGRERP